MPFEKYRFAPGVEETMMVLLLLDILTTCDMERGKGLRRMTALLLLCVMSATAIWTKVLL